MRWAHIPSETAEGRAFFRIQVYVLLEHLKPETSVI